MDQILTPHFIAVLVVAVLSETLSMTKKTKANGVIQAIGMMVQSLFNNPQDVSALETRIAELEQALKAAQAEKPQGG